VNKPLIYPERQWHLKNFYNIDTMVLHLGKLGPYPQTLDKAEKACQGQML